MGIPSDGFSFWRVFVLMGLLSLYAIDTHCSYSTFEIR